MERSFAREVEFAHQRKGDGYVFHGEGILAVTKALLQSGVGYVGGYQGSPVSQLLDVMVQAHDYLDTLGVHVEACTNEAAACAMLAASVNYPIRGAVTWKSIVGTNVASDALSNLASPGVLGGAADRRWRGLRRGVQRRAGAHPRICDEIVALPARPAARPTTHRAHGRAFISAVRSIIDAGHAPVAHPRLPSAEQLRVQRERGARAIDPASRLRRHPPRNPSRMSHPPFTFAHERLKVEARLPAARRYIVDHGINEVFEGAASDVGLIVQGGLFNNLMRAPRYGGHDGRPRREPASQPWCSTQHIRWFLISWQRSAQISAPCWCSKRGTPSSSSSSLPRCSDAMQALAPYAERPQWPPPGECSVEAILGARPTIRRRVPALASLHRERSLPGARKSMRFASGQGRCWGRRCRPGRPGSASGALNGRCSAHSNSSSASWARVTSRRTLDAILSQCSNRSSSATRSWVRHGARQRCRRRPDQREAAPRDRGRWRVLAQRAAFRGSRPR